MYNENTYVKERMAFMISYLKKTRRSFRNCWDLYPNVMVWIAIISFLIGFIL